MFFVLSALSTLQPLVLSIPFISRDNWYMMEKTGTGTAARAVPVPQSQPPSFLQNEIQHEIQHPSSEGASSYESSGSAFLSSVLNPGALSHTPPTGLGASYEAQHFGKRARSGSVSSQRSRSGSVSGRLRSSTLGSASDYLEQKGLLDRQTKGILKDLIIIGDEEMQQALDTYDNGDPSMLEDMIRSGSLQNRLPKDLDILGDLDLDFLAVEDNVTGGMNCQNIALNQPHQASGSTLMPPPAEKSKRFSSDQQQQHPKLTFASQKQLQDHRDANMLSTQYYDDGIGELEFSGDLVGDYLQTQSYGEPTSKHTSAAASPVESHMSEYDRRLRSNSIFSALLEMPPDASISSGYERWGDMPPAPGLRGVNISNSENAWCSSLDATQSGIGASLEAEAEKQETKEYKRRKGKDRVKKKQEKRGQKQKGEKKGKMLPKEEEIKVHISGSGRPRSLSDPNLRSSIDDLGLVNVDRPIGWIGAYSPESRRIRIEKFMKKRIHRTWKKTVKYDVRKNFADSRLRVKGRFVKKEDELMMRELMAIS